MLGCSSWEGGTGGRILSWNGPSFSKGFVKVSEYQTNIFHIFPTSIEYIWNAIYNKFVYSYTDHKLTFAIALCVNKYVNLIYMLYHGYYKLLFRSFREIFFYKFSWKLDKGGSICQNINLERRLCEKMCKNQD